MKFNYLLPLLIPGICSAQIQTSNNGDFDCDTPMLLRVRGNADSDAGLENRWVPISNQVRDLLFDGCNNTPTVTPPSASDYQITLTKGESFWLPFNQYYNGNAECGGSGSISGLPPGVAFDTVCNMYNIPSSEGTFLSTVELDDTSHWLVEFTVIANTEPPPPPPPPPPPAPAPDECTDAIDNDNDGLIDSADPGCVDGTELPVNIVQSFCTNIGMTPTTLPNPVLFVTQVPISADSATIGSTFSNHIPTIGKVGRGGDLYIRYTDGTLCNLTAAAGFGDSAGFQGANSIAVRDPSVHWDGARALFSMVIGAPASQYEQGTYFWQLYELSNFAQGQTPVITKVAQQPQNYNNIAPIYASDERILFVSDRPRNGATHLYPQLDEYESDPSNTGIWSLSPDSGVLNILSHDPSGGFDPIIDSFGRVLYTRWDHLQRDQQADADAAQSPPGGYAVGTYGSFNFVNESAQASMLASRDEIFPEPRQHSNKVRGLRFNHFFPWQINQDGTGLETLNHIGRHELHDYFDRSFSDDFNIVEFNDTFPPRTNLNAIENFFQIAEDPQIPGLYYGVDAPEFQTHASGVIVRMLATPSIAADQITVEILTEPSHGHFRDAVPLENGDLIAVHTSETGDVGNLGSRSNPIPAYDFQIKMLQQNGGVGFYSAGASISGGISKNLNYWDPDVLVNYSGPLWELSPVEVRSRAIAPQPSSQIPAIEAQVFNEEGVDMIQFKNYLAQKNLALIISRNVTTRDGADVQQPFNLKIDGGSAETIGAGGKIYNISHMQLLQGDQVRGYNSPATGRRVLAQLMHDGLAENPISPTAPPASVTLGKDGSMAAIVPAQRAITWQLVDSIGTPVVRERYWLNFQPGEIRVCTSCHGINSDDQAGAAEPINPPQALRDLLQFWKNKENP